MKRRTYGKNQPGGYAGLGEDGKLCPETIPDGLGGGSDGNIDCGVPASVYGGAIAIDCGGP